MKVYPEVWCSGSPAYQLNSTDGQARVLYRIVTNSDSTMSTTAWYVPTPGQLSNDQYLETCKQQGLGDLLSQPSLTLGGPDSHLYQGWYEQVGNSRASLQPGTLVVVGNFEEGDTECPATGCGDKNNMGAAGGGR